jgi:transcriptional antiterminator RfaH
VSTSKKSWYLVYVKPRQESVAQTHLVRQGYEIYLPRVRQFVRRAGRRLAQVGPMFPRYLFVHLDPCFDNWAPIRSTVGVVSIVRFGDAAARVPDELISDLRRREDEHGICPLPDTDFQPGVAVKIVEGSFAGYEAIFLARAGRDRVMLLLDLLGKRTRTVVSLDAVEPA